MSKQPAAPMGPQFPSSHQPDQPPTSGQHQAFPPHQGLPPHVGVAPYQPQPYQGYLPPGEPPRVAPTSGAAVTALISSILWLGGLGSLLALALAAASWSETRSGRRGGHGLNIAAIIIGVIGCLGAAVIWL